MDKHTNHSTEPIAQRRGLSADFRRLRSEGGATAEELNDFIRQLRGRRPQEVLGMVAQSGLMQATLVATIGCIGLMALLTVGPYAWSKLVSGEPEKADKPAAAVAGEQPTAANPSGANAVASGEQAGTPGVAAEDQEILDKLGVGETKEADPTKNPLEDQVDDLLDDLN